LPLAVAPAVTVTSDGEPGAPLLPPPTLLVPLLPPQAVNKPIEQKIKTRETLGMRTKMLHCR
jgi:hypothetical protein